MSDVMETFKAEAIAAIDRRMAVDTAKRDRLDPTRDLNTRIALWNQRGSAGRAREWFVEVAENSRTRTQAVKQLDARIANEIADKPKWYTKRHLYEVADIVRAALASPKEN